MSGKKRGSWQQLDSTQVYENPWIRVNHDRVITPAGTDGIYGVVHFKHRAVGVVPIDAESKVWLVRQFRYTLDAFSLEIPEGGSPSGESLLVTAQRELKEETGLTANRWQHLLDLHTSNSVTDESGAVFLARDLTIGTPDLEDTEDIEVISMSLDDAIEHIFQGKITDSLSVMGLLAARRWLDQHPD
jgi:8-oxo-dGTP pyrophosphatase MutT (NUDIX family)